VPLEQHWWALDGWDKLLSAGGLTILVLTTVMSLTTYISQRQLMNRQTAQVNPQQQMILRIMPLMFFVFAVNVPLAVIIYWVTTNFWSVAQQWILLRNAPQPAGAEVQAAAAGAPALVENSQERKGLGALSIFRGLTQSRTSEEPSPTTTTNKNGSRNAARASSGNKPAPKQAGSSSKGGEQARSGQGGRRQGSANRQGTSGNRQGSSGNRKSGSRSSGKGKSSGPRRGKR
jgi:YidC/Oxa1 family membrane protein insertase